MWNILKLLFTKPSLRKFKRFYRRFKKLNFRNLIKNKQFKQNIGITAFIIFLLIFFGALISEKKVEEIKKFEIDLEKIKKVKIVTPEVVEIEEKKVKEKPKVAIILDDAGGEIPDYSSIFEIKQPLTISVLPFLPMSEKIAIDSAFNGFEVMVHLPMEPFDPKYVRNDGGMVLNSMSDEEIEDFVTKSIENVKWAVGLNNHMGSSATQNERVMKAVMNVLKNKSIYFVDSKTSRNSIAYDIAKENKVLCALNNVFLDTGTDHASIEAKLNILVNRARIHGEAVGIGHATRKQTIEVLKEQMPKYSRSGIRFVYVSEVVR